MASGMDWPTDCLRPVAADQDVALDEGDGDELAVLVQPTGIGCHSESSGGQVRPGHGASSASGSRRTTTTRA